MSAFVPSEWVGLADAATLLRDRNQEPLDAIRRMLREAGLMGAGVVWLIPANPRLRRSAAPTWLNDPTIDLKAETIIVPTRHPGRRLPCDAPFSILLSRREIDRRWPAGANTTAAATIADERRCQQWLEAEMRRLPNGDARTKTSWQAEALEKFNVGPKPFGRAWAAAVSATGASSWSGPGRKKSKRRIETPV